jgi:lipoyl(octanoyl) transferase
LILIKILGVQCDYSDILAQMQAFTTARDASTPDEFWVLSHTPIFTQGLNGQLEHVLDAGEIPVVQSDRGGQVTYHGPGQLVLYTLIDLKRAHIGVREWVEALEQTVMDFMAARGVLAERKAGAPGVYVDGAKIAALGLKVRQGRCYHGLSFNLDMDLSPFARINPCGMARLPVTQWRACYPAFQASQDTLSVIGQELIHPLTRHLSGVKPHWNTP